ncbi:MAG: xanthine dehydrogenase family protein molybdopterin-binding subunit [Chromatiales bacterium]|nr:xanthine dehydrogenase family protein molybdopterin-binding subunit [Chromatiales bacterium]
MALPATRREFLRFTLLAGAGLSLGIVWREGTAATTGGEGAAFVQPFLRIDGDGVVTVICKHSELGQGVHTGLATLLAEDLDADWSQVRTEAAPAGAPGYGNLAWNPDGSIQGTGGSTSIFNSWEQLRRAGATARAMLVAAAARQWQVDAAEVEVAAGVIRHPSSGRQAGFGALAAAAAREPVPSQVTLKDPARFRLIGKAALPRTDSAAKVRGVGPYSIDHALPGLQVAVLARPPRFGARVGRVDDAAARQVPGVVDVVTVPRGVAVIARDTWSAIRGRAALRIDWDETAAETRGTDALRAEFRRLAREPSDLVVVRRGTATTALADATTRVEAEFEFPYLAHAPMEPLGAVCALSAERCEIWAGSQLQAADVVVAAVTAGLRPDQVVLHTLPSGGSFGRRANAMADFIGEVVSIAKATGGRYPVKLTWTREDDLTGGMYRPMNLHRLEAGLDADGKLIALRQRIVGQSITIGTSFAPLTVINGVDIVATSGTAAEQYPIPHVDVTWTNPAVGVPVLWWRSVEHTHTAFSKEVLIDELARRAGQDPLAYRLALLKDDPRATAVLKLAAARAGWGTPAPAGVARGLAIQASFGTVVAQVAEVRLAGGRPLVERVTCAVDCGIAVNPDVVRQQMEGGILFGLSAALGNAITLTDGRVDQRNFDTYPSLRLAEAPRIDVHIVPSTNPPTGAGEPAVPVIAPAVANAVYALTGKPLRRLPFPA